MTRRDIHNRKESALHAGACGPHHAMRVVDSTPEPDHASSSLAFADLLEEYRTLLSESLVHSAYRDRSLPGQSEPGTIRASRN